MLRLRGEAYEIETGPEWRPEIILDDEPKVHFVIYAFGIPVFISKPMNWDAANNMAEHLKKIFDDYLHADARMQIEKDNQKKSHRIDIQIHSESIIRDTLRKFLVWRR